MKTSQITTKLANRGKRSIFNRISIEIYLKRSICSASKSQAVDMALRMEFSVPLMIKWRFMIEARRFMPCFAETAKQLDCRRGVCSVQPKRNENDSDEPYKGKKLKEEEKGI